MRPSRVETSEPAWVKRKMLSMNSSTSWFCTSRKYSAMVSADRATRTGAWRFVHLAEDQGGVLEHSCFVHLHDEVVALTGTLAHTGEHRGARVVVRDAEDHLLDEHCLAHTGAEIGRASCRERRGSGAQ